MTASEHLKGVAWMATQNGVVITTLASLLLSMDDVQHADILHSVIGACITCSITLWLAFGSLWRAELHSAIDSIHLTEGTAQMQRKIIEQRNEIEKLKRK